MNFNNGSSFKSLWVISGVVLLLIQPSVCEAQENWDRFRGPNGTGVSESVNLPIEIEEEHISWEADLKGSGSSSPIVWGDQVFVTSYSKTGDKSALTLHCFELNTGKPKWEKPLPTNPDHLHQRNSPASSTPTVDQENVYVVIYDKAGMRVHVVDRESGEPKWKRELGKFPSQHGFGTSPILHEKQLLLFYSQQAQKMPKDVQPGVSSMVSLSTEDGSIGWRTNLESTRTCYGAPALVSVGDGPKQIVGFNTGNGFFGMDLNGDLKWSTMPFKKRTVASVLWTGDRLIGSCGSGGGGNYLVALKPNEKAGAEAPFEFAYQIEKANYVPSPIAIDGKLFLFSDRGIGSCFKLDDGEMLWRKRLAPGFSGSPVAADGHIYILDESGNLLTLSDAAEGEIVSKYRFGEGSRATPAIVGERLLVRTSGHLYCLKKSEK